jgi:hypothetical protein
MRSITTATGVTISLDGDLLAVLEALYRELASAERLEHTFEDTMTAIGHIIDQMNEDERRAYLTESLFLNTVTYENEKAGAYLKKLT